MIVNTKSALIITGRLKDGIIHIFMLFILINASGCNSDRVKDHCESTIDLQLYNKVYYDLEQVKLEFPLIAGMTIKQVMATAETHQSLENYNFGWKHEDIDSNGNGCIYYWTNGKNLLHCAIFFENGFAKSVWVMPGNSEMITFVWCRLSGKGIHPNPWIIWDMNGIGLCIQRPR